MKYDYEFSLSGTVDAPNSQDAYEAARSAIEELSGESLSFSLTKAPETVKTGFRHD